MKNKYPVYIISKGRAGSPLTARTLTTMGVPYRIVVEASEREAYGRTVPPENILVLPWKKKQGQASIPARNFVWWHSKYVVGSKRHWIMDDNIQHFYRLNQNRKYRIETPTALRLVEDYTDRFTNVAISGCNYDYFLAENCRYPPTYTNTRVYSCILIRNDLPFRWRGRYNEDTDLCLRVLKAGHCTILFNSILAGKITTMAMKGGNTELLYTQSNKRIEFTKALEAQHPDVVKTIWRWGRWHHHVDYTGFKQMPELRPDWTPQIEGINEHGLRLFDVDDRNRGTMLFDPNKQKWAGQFLLTWHTDPNDAATFTEHEIWNYKRHYPHLVISELEQIEVTEFGDVERKYVMGRSMTR